MEQDRQAVSDPITLNEFQRLIERLYLAKDRRRGLPGTFMWFVEEVGELSAALRTGSRDEIESEFADVLAWLSTMASLAGVELDQAAGKYTDGCPVCGKSPCTCAEPKP